VRGDRRSTAVTKRTARGYDELWVGTRILLQ
jgi:hypothetical protein